MPDYAFGGLIDASGLFTWQSGGTNPGSTIDEAGSGLPEATVGQIYTYNGGKKTAVTVRDNDGGFEEGDTTQQALVDSATIDGVTYFGTRITTTGQINFTAVGTSDTYTVFTGTVGSNSASVASKTNFYIWKDGIEPPIGSSLRVLSVSQPASIPYSALPAPCFCDGTLIRTPDGPRKVEDLKIGDFVNTHSDEPKPIRWIGSRIVTADTLSALPKLRPIVISAGSLGTKIPSTDLIVSRQHRIRISSPIVAELVGAAQALIPAIKLVGVPGVYLYEGKFPRTYYHLLLDSHSLVESNGAWTESLFLGKEFYGSMSADEREDLTAIFPEIFDEDFSYPAAAPILEKGKEIKKVVNRHLTEQTNLA